MDDLSTPATEGFGLMFYNARFYDPALGRFTSADTIVPGGVQGWDRYAYTNNNPVLYNDPSGHCGVLCAGIVVVATVSVVSLIFAGPFALSAVGHGPDTIGVGTTMAFTNTQ